MSHRVGAKRRPMTGSTTSGDSCALHDPAFRWRSCGLRSMQSISMSLPLSGLLVVSLEQAVAAPMASCRLADAGARVIKVERPEGDFARYYDKLAHGECSYFVWL